MSSVYWKERPNGSKCLIAQATTPDGQRITKVCTTRKEALAWIRAVEQPPIYLNAASQNAFSEAPDVAVSAVTDVISPDETRSAAVSCSASALSTSGAVHGSSEAPILVSMRGRKGFKMSEVADQRPVILLKDLIDRYILEIMPQKRSRRAPIQQLETWKELLGDHPATLVTAELVTKARNRLMSEVTRGAKLRTPATINRYLAALSHVFTVALKDWFLVEDNPVMKVRRGREPRGRELFLNPEQRERLLEAVSHESLLIQTVVMLALYTGMRYTEIMSLRWRQVDLERERLVLERTKNGRRRGIPLVGRALRVTQAWAVGRTCQPDALLFPSTADPTVPFDVRRGWNRVRRRMDMPELRFHDLRHCTASYLAMSGATPQEIAQVLGHRTLAMVERYAHLAEDHSRSALERMAEKMLRETENKGEKAK